MTLTARNDSLSAKSFSSRLFVSCFTKHRFDYVKVLRAFSLIP